MRARVREDPAYGAFWLLRIGFVILPLWMGIDKFINALTVWPGYLAPWIVHLLPFSAQTAMYVVGVIAVALKSRYSAYIVALWLAGIILNLLTYFGFYDVALRDIGLFVAALAMARLTAGYDHAWDRAQHKPRGVPVTGAREYAVRCTPIPRGSE